MYFYLCKYRGSAEEAVASLGAGSQMLFVGVFGMKLRC
jgi:hypothetical protein